MAQQRIEAAVAERVQVRDAAGHLVLNIPRMLRLLHDLEDPCLGIGIVSSDQTCELLAVDLAGGPSPRRRTC